VLHRQASAIDASTAMDQDGFGEGAKTMRNGCQIVCFLGWILMIGSGDVGHLKSLRCLAFNTVAEMRINGV
jgi:hypothetical protein